MAYIGPSIETGFRQRYVYTATAGQTSFSGNDSVGISLTYTDSEYLDVYQNGVLLVPGSDYAATTGTTVVLVTGASLNDKVEMIAYQAFGVADTVSRADGGAFGGAVSMASTLTVTDDANFDSGTLFVDASTNRVGIGITAPDRDLHVKGAANDPVHFKLEGDSSDYARIMFDDGSNDNIGEIRYDFGSDYMTFNTNDVERMRISSAGEITKATQPAFQIKSGTSQDNISINANTTVVMANEHFDVGSNVASNTFTAPVTGKYQLSYQIRLDQLDIDTGYYIINLVTSNRSYQYIQGTSGFDADMAYMTFAASQLCDMDASDTAFVQVSVINAGAAQVDITTESTFSGFLAC